MLIPNAISCYKAVCDDWSLTELMPAGDTWTLGASARI